MTRIATFLRPVPVTATALAAATGAWLAWTPVAGAEAAIEPGSIADLVERTGPSVVTILATQESDKMAGMREGSPFPPGSPFEEFLRRFGMPDEGAPIPPQPRQGQRGIGLGSGFVIEQDGYIVTNNHVVDQAKSLKVRLSDEREFDAEVIGTDPQTDLALIKIDATGLPELEFGDSDALRVGEDVIAVGNPFGLGGTVTRGIVSAMARDINAGPYVDFIQTDAAINHGNSGGPLLNLEGEVVGVNSAIYSPNGGSVGVGFAVPSTTAQAVIAQLQDGGPVERGWLGVSIQQVTPEIAAAIGLDDPHGALVSDVVADGPSAGNLRDRRRDPFVRRQARRVRAATCRSWSRPWPPTRRLPSRCCARARPRPCRSRSDGSRRSRPRRSKSNESDESRASERLGATLATLTPTARDQLGLDTESEGVVITSSTARGLPPTRASKSATSSSRSARPPSRAPWTSTTPWRRPRPTRFSCR